MTAHEDFRDKRKLEDQLEGLKRSAGAMQRRLTFADGLFVIIAAEMDVTTEATPDTDQAIIDWNGAGGAAAGGRRRRRA